jgi:hypothetical protein
MVWGNGRAHAMRPATGIVAGCALINRFSDYHQNNSPWNPDLAWHLTRLLLPSLTHPLTPPLSGRGDESGEERWIGPPRRQQGHSCHALPCPHKSNAMALALISQKTGPSLHLTD